MDLKAQGNQGEQPILRTAPVQQFRNHYQLSFRSSLMTLLRSQQLTAGISPTSLLWNSCRTFECGLFETAFSSPGLTPAQTPLIPSKTAPQYV